MDNQPQASEQDSSAVQEYRGLTESELDKFLTRQRDRHVEALQESLARKLKHTHDDAEQAIDYTRKLIREGADVEDALREMQLMANSLLLMVGVLRLEAGRG